MSNTNTAKDKQKAKRLYTTYGITLEEWQEMWDDQKGVCKICKTLPKSGRLCIDHLHAKGYKKMSPEDKKKYVRALICFGCNTVFSRFERRTNSRWLFEQVQKYFELYPMKGDVL